MTTVFTPNGLIGPVEEVDYHVALGYYPEGEGLALWDVARWDSGGANLAPAAESTFESGIGTWTGLFGTTTCTQQAAAARTGSFGMRSRTAIAGNATPFTFGPLPGNAVVAVAPGVTYRYTAWIRSATVARTARISLVFMDAGGAQIGGTPSPDIVTNTATSTQLVCIATAPATAAYACFFIDILATALNEDHYIDDVSLTIDAPAGGVWLDDEPPWNDVSEKVTTVRVARGHDLPLDRFRPGALTFTLYDPDGQFSPWRTAYDPAQPGAIRPGIEVKVWVDDDGTEYPRFRGYVDAITDVFPDPSVADSHEVQFTAFDSLGVVAAFQGPDQPVAGAGEAGGARIARILANAMFTGPRDLAPGAMALQGTVLEKNALDEIGLVTDTDGGAFFALRDGTVVYLDANALVTDPHYTGVQVTFGEVEPEVCYSDIRLADDVEKVRNYVTIAPAGGSEVVHADYTSIGYYKPRAHKRTDLIHSLASDSDVIAQRILDTFAYAARRIEGFTIDMMLLDAADRLDVLELDLLWRIEVRRRAEGFQTVAELQIMAIGEEVDPDSWVLTINTFDAAEVFNVARWDNAVWDTGLWGY